MTVGDRIRMRREELGWTQQQLADKIGANSKSIVSRTEASGNDVTTKQVVRYAQALGCSKELLLGLEIPSYSTESAELINKIAQDERLRLFVMKFCSLSIEKQNFIMDSVDRILEI